MELYVPSLQTMRTERDNKRNSISNVSKSTHPGRH